MTNHEAAIIIGNIPIDGKDECYTVAQYQQAKLLAIQALESQKTGHWIEYIPDHHRCSNCNKDAFVKWHTAKRDNVDILTNYCHNCGSRMEVEE